MAERLEEKPDAATPLELFFDLVFVFTITQLTYNLANHPDGEGVLQTALMLGVIWWMYGGFVWLTNSVTQDRDARRLLLLGGMGCFMVIALAIPSAFGDDGDVFALAYFGVILIHAGLFTQASSGTAAKAIFTTVRWNLAGAVLILLSSLSSSELLEYALWGMALLTLWASAFVQDTSGYVISAKHFVERHGLVVIVALGESVVVVGVNASEQPLTAELLAVALLGLALTACLWWSYFAGPEEQDTDALAAVPDERRAKVALVAYYFSYLPLLLGIVAVAAGLKEVIAHPHDALPLAKALFLGAGAAAYLLAEVAYRHVLGVPFGPWRAIAAALAVATVPLGTEGSALLQLGVLVPAVALCLFADRGAEWRTVSAA